jgi:uncharacterized protein (TIGR02996 family)
MEALWARVYAQPDDEEARRVLADALLERGDPRGELIAVQCRLAGIDEDERDAALKALAQRERALLDQHGAGWVHGWPFELLPHFVRGFPERQHANAGDVAPRLSRALNIAPLLRELVFTDEDPRDWVPGFRLLCASQALDRFRRLTLPITFQPLDLELLAGLQVRSLGFTGGTLGSLAPLSQLPLEELTFDFDMVGMRDFAALAGLPLKSFVNRGTRSNGLPAWPTLERLTIDRVSIAVGPAHYPRLTRLELFGTNLGRRGLTELLGAGHPRVTRLGIRGERLDSEHVALLERWPALEVLDLTGCTVPARALQESTVVQRLRCRIGWNLAWGGASPSASR